MQYYHSLEKIQNSHLKSSTNISLQVYTLNQSNNTLMSELNISSFIY